MKGKLYDPDDYDIEVVLSEKKDYDLKENDIKVFDFDNDEFPDENGVLSDEELKQKDIERVKEDIARETKLTDLLKKLKDIQTSGNKLLKAISIRKVGSKISEIIQQADEAYENAAEMYGKKAKKYAEDKEPIIEEYKKQYKKIGEQHKLKTVAKIGMLDKYQKDERNSACEKSSLISEREKLINSHRKNVNKLLNAMKSANNKNDIKAYQINMARLAAIKKDYSIILKAHNEQIKEKDKELIRVRNILNYLNDYLYACCVDSNKKLDTIKAIKDNKMAKLEKPKFWEKIAFVGLFNSYKGVKKFSTNVVDKLQKGTTLAKEFLEELKVENAIRSAENAKQRAAIEKQKADARVNRANAKADKMEQRSQAIQQKAGIVVDQQEEQIVEKQEETSVEVFEEQEHNKSNIIDFEEGRKYLEICLQRELARLEGQESPTKIRQNNTMSR